MSSTRDGSLTRGFRGIGLVATLLFAAVIHIPAQEGGTDGPAYAGSISGSGNEYLLGLGVSFGAHAVQAHGSVLPGEPVGFNVGAGYRSDALQVIGLYRQDAPGRLPYMAVTRDRQGGLLLFEYTPPAPDLRLTLENELFVGRVELRNSGEQLALYDLATVAIDVLADYQNRITLVGDFSMIQLLEAAGGAYSLGMAAPMQFLDRTVIVEPRLLHSGTTRQTPEFGDDLIGYRFGDFSVGRLDGVRNETVGTTALVLNVEYRHHFLRSSRVPVVDGVFLAGFADGGLFWTASDGSAMAGDFTFGGGLGIDWLQFSLTARAGYNHADQGFVWGIDFKSYR